MVSKTCTLCNKNQKLSEYVLTSSIGHRYPHSRCKTCMRKYQRLYNKKGMVPLTDKELHSL